VDELLAIDLLLTNTSALNWNIVIINISSCNCCSEEGDESDVEELHFICTDVNLSDRSVWARFYRR